MRYLLLFAAFIISCQSNFTKIDTLKKTSAKQILYQRISKKYFSIDTVKFDNFDEYLSFIPDLELPIKFEKVILPLMSDTLQDVLAKCNYGPEHHTPIARIIKQNFVAILYFPASQGDYIELYTIDKTGEIIDKALIFRIDGFDSIDSVYRKVEKCTTTIDEKLNVYYKHYPSFLVRINKFNFNVKDSIRLSDSETHNYKVDINGRIIKSMDLHVKIQGL